MNDDFLIDCMENEIESSYFDFKKDIYDFNITECKQEFLTDILSFANSHSKGDKYIITGIKLYNDNTRDFNGITESKIKDGADYQSIINDNIEPNIIIDFKIVEYNSKKYGIFKISGENKDQPYILSKKYNKLEKGFIKIRKGQKNEFVNRRDFDLFYKEKNYEQFSDIFIKGLINKEINDKFEVNKFKNEFDSKKIKKIIVEEFEKIKNIKLIKSSDGLKLGEKITIDENDITIIKNYAKDNCIELSDDFFDIGNITYFSFPHASTSYQGSNTEKQKYSLIRNLLNIISIFHGISEYYKKVDNIYYTELVIYNNGKKFDEDIEITLKIKKEQFMNFNQFPIPSEAIIEKILDDDFLNKYIENEKVNGINTYTSKNPRFNPVFPTPIKLSAFGYSNPEYEEYKDYYIDNIKSIADYEINEDEKYYYIKFNQREIKPNELIFLPSRILFFKMPDLIEYEIKSKHNPNIKKGKLEVKKDN